MHSLLGARNTALLCGFLMAHTGKHKGRSDGYPEAKCASIGRPPSFIHGLGCSIQVDGGMCDDVPYAAVR